MMNKGLLVISGLLSLLLVAGCNTTPERRYPTTPVTVPETKPLAEARDPVNGAGFVHTVDAEKREIQLKGKGDKIFTVAVSEDVKSLGQLKAGDRVDLSYYEAVALDVGKNAKRSTPTRRELTTTHRAPSSQKWADTARKEIEIIGDVTSIKKKTRQVGLQSGRDAVTMRVPDDIDISTLKVGQQVTVRYVQELAVAVKPVKTAAPVADMKKKGMKNNK